MIRASLICALTLFSTFSSFSQDRLIERDCLVYKLGCDTPYTGNYQRSGRHGLRIKGAYIDGLRHGVWREYTPVGGSLKSISKYNHGCIVKWRGYYRNNKISKGKYLPDCDAEEWKDYGEYCSLFKETDLKRDGKWKLYNLDGKLKEVKIYKNGELIESKTR